MVKTLASSLLISAAFVAAIAYAGEPSGEPEYPPAISEISVLSRAQVVAELEAKAVGRLIFGENEEPSLSATGSGLTREHVRADAAATYADDSYPFGELDYKAAFSVPRSPRG